MNNKLFYKYCLCVVSLFITFASLKAQDSLHVPYSDSLFTTDLVGFRWVGFAPSCSYFMLHFPNNGDDSIYNNYKQLAYKLPTSENYDTYYQLACSLWEFSKLDTAESMFLTIMQSAAPYYCEYSYHSSGTLYGYGSYTTNYKNGASIYLAKIYLEKKNYAKTLAYTKLAINKHKAEFSCGTGYYLQQEEYDFLLASAYEGLKNYNGALNILMPKCLGEYNEMALRIIKRAYSPEEVKKELVKTERSVNCNFDIHPSMSITNHSSSDTANYSDTSYYYSGNAEMTIFGYKVAIPTPHLANGEHVTRDMFIEVYRRSTFLETLADYAGLPVKKHDDADIQYKSVSIN